MIDRSSGEIRFRTVRVDPSLGRTAFLDALPADRIEPLVDNPPHRSYAVSSEDRHGNPFRLSVYYDEERLTMVHLAAVDGRFGQSWDEWSKEKELARKAHHTHWLAEECGMEASEAFAWGTVSCLFDEKSGASSIIVRYAAN